MCGLRIQELFMEWTKAIDIFFKFTSDSNINFAEYNIYPLQVKNYQLRFTWPKWTEDYSLPPENNSKSDKDILSSFIGVGVLYICIEKITKLTVNVVLLLLTHQYNSCTFQKNYIICSYSMTAFQ